MPQPEFLLNGAQNKGKGRLGDSVASWEFWAVVELLLAGADERRLFPRVLAVFTVDSHQTAVSAQ